MSIENRFVAQLDDVLEEYEREAAFINEPNGGYAAARSSTRFLTRARAVIERIAGPGSAYRDQCDDVLSENAVEAWKASRLVGVLESLRADVAAGYLEAVSQLIHGEVFGDFLDMAEHLQHEGYKDAAAVVAGSALEAHLRTLCDQAGIERESNGRVHKADRMNADLARSGVYSGIDQKNVTSWLGLRNDAAHGNYESYTADQVRLLVASVRDFISPASRVTPLTRASSRWRAP
ncbi:MAG: hypothetical protein IBX63_11455 [Coriobacteriia bacterium]|nr:hypothetical protein [Coriobacteriia bacterium]